MKKTTTTQKCASKGKPGLLKRLVSKVDSAMKEKAEAKARQGSCCGDDDNKGGKCC